MSKRRIKFSKLGDAQYISHLDLLRTFSRAIIRAKLPVRYSQGFNPHQIMTFSLPLSIGVTSECEFVDIDFEDNISDFDIIKHLNENLPPDIRILEIADPIFRASNICSAEYNVRLILHDEISKKKIEAFFAEPEILITKRTKKRGEVKVNLLDFIKGSEVKEIKSGKASIRMILSAGENNLKPELAVNALCEYLKPSIIDGFYIHRINIFCKNGEKVEKFC